MEIIIIMNIKRFIVFSLLGAMLGSSPVGAGEFRMHSGADACLFPCETPYPLTVTGRFGESYLEGQVDLMIPLGGVSSSGVAPFSLLSYNRNDYGAETLSLGLGARWINYDLNSVLGFRIHGDLHETAAGNQYSQLGLGFDLFHGSGFDIHANYNFALDSGTRRSYRTSSQSSSTSEFDRVTGQRTDVYDPYAQGHQILQDCLHYDSIDTVNQTTTTNISRFFQEFERGREGGDIRMVFDVAKHTPRIFAGKGGKQIVPQDNCHVPKLRGMVGGYYYDSHYGDSFAGVMAGMNAHLAPGLTVGVEYYADEELYGENWLGTVGVSVPVQHIFNPREFGRNLFKSPTDCSSNDYLASRMYAGAPRLTRPILEQSGPIEDVSQQIVDVTVSEQVVGSREVLTSTETAVIQDDVVFVNNGAAVGNGIAGQTGLGIGDGTAENPGFTIQEGANLVASELGGSGTVYVQESGNVYAETVEVGTLSNGSNPNANASTVSEIHFTSSFKGIEGKEGRVFGGDTERVQVEGGFDLRNDLGNEVLNTASVTGFHVTGGIANAPPGGFSNYGILSGNVANFTANCNIVESATRGIVYNNWTGSAGTVDIFDNIVDNTFRESIRIESQGIGTEIQAAVYDNAVSNNGVFGIIFDTMDGASVVDGIVNNNIIENTGKIGLYFLTRDGNSSMSFNEVNGNQFINQGGDGVYMLTFGDSSLQVAEFSGNTFDNILESGFEIQRDNTATVEVSNITDNTFTNITDAAFSAVYYGTAGGNTTLTNISNNTFDTVGNGIQIWNEADGQNVVVADVTGNTVDNLTVFLDPSTLATSSGPDTFYGNAFGLFAGAGISGSGSSSITATNVSDNTFGSAAPLVRGTSGSASANHGFRIIEDGVTSAITLSGNGNTVTFDAAPGVDTGATTLSTGSVSGSFEANGTTTTFATDPYRQN